MNYHKKIFRPVENTDNGETSSETVFFYEQIGDIVRGTYQGGEIVSGQLLARILSDASLDMRYQQINKTGEIRTGICHSIPEILSDGRIRLYESWQWTSGDFSKGNSIIEEQNP